VLAAAGGVGFTKVLYGIEDLCDRLWHGPEWLRPAAGGVLLGGLVLALPEMYGVGYPILENGVAGHYVAWFLIVLLIGKMVATSLTIGIGGSGGVFAPSLFMGAMLGTAYGDGVHQILPHLTASAGAYGLVGMGALFAGATRAPITGVLIIFELTGDYTIVLPLMVAIVVATAVSGKLSKDTIYTLKLRRRGIDITGGRPENLMRTLTLSDAMQPVPAALASADPLERVIKRFTDETREALPVIDRDGCYRGTVSAQEVEQSIAGDADVTAGDLARLPPTVHATQLLHDAVQTLIGGGTTGVPVVSTDGSRIVGWVNPTTSCRPTAPGCQPATPPVPSRRRPRHRIDPQVLSGYDEAGETAIEAVLAVRTLDGCRVRATAAQPIHPVPEW
jgi:CIC family chloride channel protein